MGRYRDILIAKCCGKRLSGHDAFYNNGVCPYCGDVTIGTIVAYHKKAIYVPTFWEKLRGVKHEIRGNT